MRNWFVAGLALLVSGLAFHLTSDSAPEVRNERFQPASIAVKGDWTPPALRQGRGRTIDALAILARMKISTYTSDTYLLQIDYILDGTEPVIVRFKDKVVGHLPSAPNWSRVLIFIPYVTKEKKYELSFMRVPDSRLSIRRVDLRNYLFHLGSIFLIKPADGARVPANVMWWLPFVALITAAGILGILRRRKRAIVPVILAKVFLPAGVLGVIALLVHPVLGLSIHSHPAVSATIFTAVSGIIKIKSKAILLVIFLVAYFGALEYIFKPQWTQMKNSKFFSSYQRLEQVGARYKWSENLKLIGVKVGLSFSNFRGEYTDKWKSIRLNGLDIGFFDNGLDDKKPERFLVFGDSIARGVGSVEPSRNGWVPVSERMSKIVDMVNLASVGGSTFSSLHRYKRLKGRIPHTGVVVSFNGIGDFLDNLNSPITLDEFINSLPGYIDKNFAIRKTFRGNLVYHAAIEFMLNSPIRSYTVFSILNNLHARGFSFTEHDPATNNFQVSKVKAYKANPKLYELWERKKALNKHREPKKRFYRDLARYSASLVNQFTHLVGQEKKIILIIHPRKSNVYSVEKVDDFMFDKFKQRINGKIKICDTTEAMRKKAKTSSRPIYYKKDPHPTPFGYKFIGKVVANCLVRFSHLP